MRFGFDRLVPAQPRWFLPILELSSSALSASIRAFANEHLLPAIRDVATVGRLLSLLVEDVEPFPWVVSNEAIRAAQIVALAGLSRRAPVEVYKILRCREKFIARGFTRESPMRDDPGSYIDHILADWGATPRQSERL
jgi:hypothetical protein